MTKMVIAETMKKLMEQRSFDKISVLEICDCCGINRKSFYYHFRDKYDLVNWIFYVDFVSELDLDQYASGWDLLKATLDYFWRERKFYRAAFKIEGQNSFREYFMETAKPVEKFFLQDILPRDENDSFTIDFLTDILLVLLVRWLENGYDHAMDAEEFYMRIRGVLWHLSVSTGSRHHGTMKEWNIEIPARKRMTD